MKDDSQETLPAQLAYDQWAEEYEDTDPTTLLDEPFLRSRLQLFDGCRVLDLGCGTGRYLRQVSQPGVRAVGMDLSRAMLARARRTIRPAAPIALVQASIVPFPFAPEVFDRVIAGLVIDHVDDLPSFFRQVAVLLRLGGRLIMSAVHPDMQRLTGESSVLPLPGREYGHKESYTRCARSQKQPEQPGLAIETLIEPRVDEELIGRRPAWMPSVPPMSAATGIGMKMCLPIPITLVGACYGGDRGPGRSKDKSTCPALHHTGRVVLSKLGQSARPSLSDGRRLC